MDKAESGTGVGGLEAAGRIGVSEYWCFCDRDSRLATSWKLEGGCELRSLMTVYWSLMRFVCCLLKEAAYVDSQLSRISPVADVTSSWKQTDTLDSRISGLSVESAFCLV